MEELRFNPSPPLTLGIELEWQILDPKNGRLKNQSIKLLNAIKEQGGTLAKHFKPEGVRNMLEVNSSIHETPGTLLEELYALQEYVQGPLKHLNLALAGGGTHPFETWEKREIFPSRRYLKLHKIYGFLWKSFSVYSEHIHIGCTSAEDALYLTHALSSYVPHFIALSASSPYYFGVDTHFDCSRLTVISAFPSSGVMPFLLNWHEFENYFDQLCKLRLINSIKDLYWDIRPKPEFGTVELRICDSPLTLKKAAALAAYAQALAAFLLDTRPHIDPNMYFPYKYNRFSAMRYGLNAVLFNIKDGSETPLVEEIVATLNKVQPYARMFNSESCLNELEQLCYDKNSDAKKMRTLFRQRKNLPAVVGHAIDAWLSRDF